MIKSSNGTERLSVQALFAYVPVNDVPDAMVRRTDARNVLGIFAVQSIQDSSLIDVILWSASDSGAVVPLCDFQYSITYSPVFTGLSPPFAFGGVCALARARPRKQKMASTRVLTNVLLWVDIRSRLTLLKNRDR